MPEKFDRVILKVIKYNLTIFILLFSIIFFISLAIFSKSSQNIKLNKSILEIINISKPYLRIGDDYTVNQVLQIFISNPETNISQITIENKNNLLINIIGASAESNKEELSKTFYLFDDDDDDPYIIKITYNDEYLIYPLVATASAFIIIVLLILMLGLRANKIILKKSMHPFKLVTKILENYDENAPDRNEINKFVETKKIYQKLKNLHEKIIFQRKTIEDEEKKIYLLSIKEDIAQQVAHDIRSPLTALNVVSKDLSGLPEESRVLLRSSIERIQDIANNLVSKSEMYDRGVEDNIGQEVLRSKLLLPIIEEILSEKRYQLKDKVHVDITLDSEEAYGLFAKVDERILKRVLSNLINNSIEAFEDSGKVVVQIAKCIRYDEVLISVKDDGKGIPKNILPKLGQKGVSFGKAANQESGAGLGLYYAKYNIEKWGGRFAIESEQGKGTEIKLYLPNTESPDWFVQRINLSGIKTIIILDDDESIHKVWDKRLKTYVKKYNIDLKHARCPEDFKLLIEGQANLLCLCDYELLGFEETALDLIEENSLEAVSILVTCRYAEEKVQERCEKLGIKLIPKTSADLVPLTV
ncbi:MAG TPA: HAMP domain-containing sensor histidine kinase [Oligoflexia bacterium]|nr:HAMP domain-containing sensor histidine kinase [Oligoflexia bacterium]HMR25460.1 HAMP domain-containing sensor histidine kinase [Oligoflexia bacterium]